MITKILTYDGRQWVEGVPAATVANWMSFKFLIISLGQDDRMLVLFDFQGKQDRSLNLLVAAGLVGKQEDCIGGGIGLKGSTPGTGIVQWDSPSLRSLLGYDQPNPPDDAIILAEVRAELTSQQLI